MSARKHGVRIMADCTCFYRILADFGGFYRVFHGLVTLESIIMGTLVLVSGWKVKQKRPALRMLALSKTKLL